MFENGRLAAIVWILVGACVVALFDILLIVKLLRGQRRFSVIQVALMFAVIALLWTAFSSTPVFWGRETTLLSKVVDIGVVVCIYTGLAVSPLAIERAVPWITGKPRRRKGAARQ